MSPSVGVLPTVRGLALACHPLPCVAVTTFAAALGVVAGASAGQTALLAAAVLSGQLGIGWLNDLHDAGIDVAAGRTDKPVVRGDIGVRSLQVAVALSVPVCLLLSFAMGLVPGLLHLVLVGAGWSYDLALKPTPFSAVPYVVAFGVLPLIAATAAGTEPSWTLAAAAALLGVGGHFANTLDDEEADALTDVRGLPQRLGAARSQPLAGACVVAACGVILAASTPALPAAVLLLGAAALGAVAALGPRRLAFRMVLVSTAVALAGIVATG